MSKDLLDILLIEDNLGDARLLDEMLKENPTTIELNIQHVRKLKNAIDLIAIERFDLVLLDLGLPDSQGLQTFNSLVKVTKEIPIVLLTGLDDEAVALEAVQSGAQDYLIKGKISTQELIRSVRYAIERNRYIERIKDQSEGIENNSVLDKKIKSLTKREYEVLTLVIKGISNLEISKLLFISSHTVKNHISKIYKKLEVEDRVHLMSVLYQGKDF